MLATGQDVIAQGEALVKAGKYAEAFALLEPLEDKFAGDIKFDYLLARSALETGKPSRASFIYERILALEPNYAGVRLEMGLAYLQLGDYARAKLEFESVLRFDNLPPSLREQALIYAKAAEGRIAGSKLAKSAYLEIGYGYDSNVSFATGQSQILTANGATLILPPEALKRSDHYKAVSLGGELAYALTENFSTYGGADIRTRSYNNIDTADNDTVDGRAGLGYNSGAHNVRLGVNAGRYWLDYEKLRNTAGSTLDYRYLATKQDQITTNIAYTRFRFPAEQLRTQDFNMAQLTLGWLHASEGGKAVAGFNLLGGRENAVNGRADGDKNFYGVRLTLTGALTEKISAFFFGGAQRAKYQSENELFGTKRDDDFYDATTGVSWSLAPGWSFRPQVVYYKNKSNIPLFQYNRTEASLNLRLDL